MKKKTFWLDGEDRSLHTDAHSDPTTLIGKRVGILWAKGKRYHGTVQEYNAKDGTHKVVYDDSSEKWSVPLLYSILDFNRIEDPQLVSAF
jgi:hypothetical protein